MAVSILFPCMTLSLERTTETFGNFSKFQCSDRSICNIGTQMSIFGSIHLQHWYPNYPNINIWIDPFATLVPKLPKCQYSDRSICNIGTQFTTNHIYIYIWKSFRGVPTP